MLLLAALTLEIKPLMADPRKILISIELQTKKLKRAFGQTDGMIKRSMSKFDKLGASIKKSINNGASGAKKSLKGLGASLSQGIGKAGQATKKFGQLGKQVLGKALVAGAALAVTAIAAIGVAAIAAAVKLSQMGEESAKAMRLLQARTGASDEQMKALSSTATNLFNKGLGQNIGDVAEVLGRVKSVTQASGQELETLTHQALVMRDVFGKDVEQSVRAVNTAIDTFGESGTKTMDLMAAAIQRTGDPADDLADTVNEYSTLFSQAGFSQEQMFGVLEQGLNAGARNFDVVADSVKEFLIRIQDGSDSTRDALNDMFNAVGEGNPEIARLEKELVDTNVALDRNKKALEDSKGAYAASKKVVAGLQKELNKAKRELAALARPNLKGVQQFDDRMFDLGQQAKRTELALLDAVPDSDHYNSLKAQLDDINTQMDRVALERDLTIEPQLRAIEQAATAGTEPLVTFDQAMSDIANKRTEIAGLEGALGNASMEMQNNAASVQTLTAQNDILSASVSQIEASLANAKSPADEFLAGFTDGSLTGADAMQQVIDKLMQVQDPIKQNEIGVALFGTKWEDLGPKVLGSLNVAEAGLVEFEGATLAAGETVNDGLGATWTKITRMISSSLAPLGQLINQGLLAFLPFIQAFADKAAAWFLSFSERAQPIVTDFSQNLRTTLGPALTIIRDAINRVATALGIGSEKTSAMDVILIVLKGTLDAVVIGIQAVAIAADLTSKAIEGVSSAIETAITWVKNLGNAFSNNLTGALDGATSKLSSWGDTLGGVDKFLPDWMRPGSPPPLFYAIGDITKALNKMPELAKIFEVDAAPLMGLMKDPSFDEVIKPGTSEILNGDQFKARQQEIKAAQLDDAISSATSQSDSDSGGDIIFEEGAIVVNTTSNDPRGVGEAVGSALVDGLRSRGLGFA